MPDSAGVLRRVQRLGGAARSKDISPVDAVGMRFAAFNPNIVTTALSTHGLGIEYGTTGANTGSYRLDNSVKYNGTFGPVTAKAMYSFGENQGSTSAQASRGLGSVYNDGGLAMSGAYQCFKSANQLELEGATLGASYQWGVLRLAAIFGRSAGETSATGRTVQRVASSGVTWAATPLLDATAAFYRLSRERTGAAEDGYSRVILFTEYKLSRRTRLYAEGDYRRWRNSYQGAANKSVGRGVTLGVLHAF